VEEPESQAKDGPASVAPAGPLNITVPDVIPQSPQPFDELLKGWRARTRALRVSGDPLFAAAAAAHLLSIPLALILLKTAIENATQQALPWDGLFPLLNRWGSLWIVQLGIGFQTFMALVPLLAAALFHRGWIGASGPVLLTAIVAIPLSIVLYGGILAAAGGVLTIAGTLLATREGTT